MEEGPFSNAEIADYINTYFIPAKIKTTNNEAFNTPFGNVTTQQLGRMLQIRGVPSVYFFNSDGKVVFNVPGYVPSDMYSVILRYVAEKHYEDKSFQEFQQDLEKES
jgi:thioredoxin-related protein